MQLITGISRNTQSIYYMLSLTECVWEFRNNALCDTHYHAPLDNSDWINFSCIQNILLCSVRGFVWLKTYFKFISFKLWSFDS